MKALNRRSFIRNSALTMTGAVFANSVFANPKIKPKLSFSTLGCPKWTFSEILDSAVNNGYEGIEFRGMLGEFDLTKCPEFSTVSRISATKKIIGEKHLKVSCLGASAKLHFVDNEIRKNNLDDARKFIDLAQQLDCPYVRVFPDIIPKNQGFDATIDLITQGLIDLAEYAKGSNVSVLLESHGDVVEIDNLLGIMKNSENPHVGMVWDICNMWTVTKEPPSLVYKKLKKYIKHTHFRDVKYIGNKYKTVLFGQGEAPVLDAVRTLVQGGYEGYYSLEWEKYWEPDIEEPEIAFPQYSKMIKKYLKSL